jgi:signal transduction histidine kinase
MTFKRKACFIITGFFYFIIHSVSGQDQKLADSLARIYQNSQLADTARMELLRKLAYNEVRDLKLGLKYADELISLSAQKGNDLYLFRGYQNKGNKKILSGDLEQALDAYFKSVKAAIKAHYVKGEGSSYISIADVYAVSGNHPNTMLYYNKAIVALRQSNDSVLLASAITNAGGEYLNNKQYDSALLYFRESTIISEKINYFIGKAYNLGNIGMLYANTGNTELAEKNINEAIGLLEKNEVYDPICAYLLSMSDIYFKKNDERNALNYALRSLKLAEQYGLKDQISEANLKLSQLYEKVGNQRESLKYYKNYIVFRDSVNNLESVQKMGDLRTDFEVSQKQKEVDLLATRNKLRIAERNGFVFASLLLAAILVISVYFYTQRAKRNKLIAAQKMQEAEIVHQKNLMQSVITSQEAERKRIGMDLHDEVGAALSTLRIKIDRNDGEEAMAADLTANYKSDIDKIIANMRNISHALSPRISGNFGFYDAIHELSDGVNRSGKINMAVHFDESKLPVFTNEQAPMALYRVIAELINNTLKHAQAKHIQLAVDVADDKMKIDYSDDGIGISQKPGGQSQGMGMKNIESRLGIIGATWQVQEPETGGYGLVITVPLQNIA